MASTNAAGPASGLLRRKPATADIAGDTPRYRHLMVTPCAPSSALLTVAENIMRLVDADHAMPMSLQLQHIARTMQAVERNGGRELDIDIALRWLPAIVERLQEAKGTASDAVL